MSRILPALFAGWIVAAPLPAQVQPDPQTLFEVSGFAVSPGAGGAPSAWRADVRTMLDIQVHAFVVRWEFVNRTGASALAGEDIPLPAGRAGQSFTVTRPFQQRPDLSALVLAVVRRADGAVVARTSFPVAGAAMTSGSQSVVRPGAAAPDRLPAPGGAAPPAPEIELSVAQRQVQGERQWVLLIRNGGDATVHLEQPTAVYRFLTGAEGRQAVSCRNGRLAPGQGCEAVLEPARFACAALASVWVDMKVNGDGFSRQALAVDAPLRSPSTLGVTLRTDFVSRADGMDAQAWADYRLSGNFVREDTRLLLKALVQVDGGSLFPVVHPLSQGRDGIEGGGWIVSGTPGTPISRVCLNVLEVTTDDSLTCGGVGIVLYRRPALVDGMFLHDRACR